MATIQPKVTLVGAGPGDPDLLTIKGAKALADAQVVLYDALANDVLLNYAPNALKIFVGKRKNKHTRTNDDKINNEQNKQSKPTTAITVT